MPHENHCWFWTGITKGAWSLPFGLTTTCAQPIKS
jgi:predicted NUDIX family NTP pyrophosphohydrolase